MKQDQGNFRFRAGVFGGLILQKRVYEKSDKPYTWFYWEDAKIEDLCEHFSASQVQQDSSMIYKDSILKVKE